MEYILNQIINLDIAQLIAIGLIVWFSYSRLDRKIEAKFDKIDAKIDKIDAKIDGVWMRLDATIDGLEKRLDAKIDGVEKRLCDQIQKLDDRLTAQIQKLDEKVTDIDRRVCRLEGAFNNKDCCMIKSDSQLKKAE